MEEKRFLLLPAYVAQAGASLSTAGVMSFLPLFLAELYGSDSSVMLWAGLAAGMAPLAAAFSAPFWSLGACRWGPKRVMTAILLCLSLSLAFVSMAEKGWQVLAFRFLQGMAGGHGTGAAFCHFHAHKGGTDFREYGVFPGGPGDRRHFRAAAGREPF